MLDAGADEYVRGRANCIPQPDWLEGAGKRLRVCKYNPERSVTDYVLWGDSHAGMLFVPLGEEVTAMGKSLVVVTLAGCPPMIGVGVSGRKNTGCPKVGYDLLKAIERERPKAVIVATRWANLASDMRAPGDGGRPRVMWDAEGGGAVMPLADALARTVQRLRRLGSSLVVVGPVPEIEFHVPGTMMRALNGLGSLPEVSRASFDLRQKQVFAAMADLKERGMNIPVVWPHEVLCTSSLCRVAEGSVPLYRDDDHLNVFGARLVVRQIGDVLRGDGVH